MTPLEKLQITTSKAIRPTVEALELTADGTFTPLTPDASDDATACFHQMAKHVCPTTLAVPRARQRRNGFLHGCERTDEFPSQPTALSLPCPWKRCVSKSADSMASGQIIPIRTPFEPSGTLLPSASSF